MSDEKPSEKSESGSGGLVVKAVAGVFATVVAPVAVAFGIKYSETLVASLTAKSEPPKAAADSASTPSASAPAASDASLTKGGDKTIPAVRASAPPAASPLKPAKASAELAQEFRDLDAPVQLFNKVDLSGLNINLRRTKRFNSTPGKNKDPDQVFTVKDGLLRISGEFPGNLSTDQGFSNYRLTVEFKWGDAKWGDGVDKPRSSGILLHCSGGALTPRALQCRLAENGTGDLTLLAGEGAKDVSLTSEMAVTAAAKNDGSPRYEFRPGEPVRRITEGCLHRMSTGGDPEAPKGEWNRVECIALDKSVRVLLNGKLVNAATRLQTYTGRIGIQSLQSELYIRKIELQRIEKRK